MRVASQLLPALVLVAGILPAGRAHAGQCDPPTIDVFPAYGSVDVPSNTRIWVGEAEGIAPTLVGPDGWVSVTRTTISTSTWAIEEEAEEDDRDCDADECDADECDADDECEEPLGGPWLNDVAVFIPTSRLTPGTYVFADGLTEFTVGDVEDHERHLIPRVLELDYHVSRERAVYQADRFVDLILDSDYDLVVIDAQHDSRTLFPQALSGGVTDVVSGNRISFGRGRCVHNWDATPGESARIRLGAFDHAGNFSGWGEWVDIDLPERPGCSIDADGRRPTPLVFLFIAGILLGTRRRRADS